MSSNRREILAMAGAMSGAATLGAGRAAATGNASPVRPTPPALFPPRPVATRALVPDGRLTVNRERAYRFMKEAGVDAIVGASDDNSRYLTNMRSVISEMGLPRRTIGVMSADPTKPIIAITPSVDIGRYTRPGREWPAIITYSAPRDPNQYRNMPKLPGGSIGALSPPRWPASTATPMSPLESEWERNEKSLPTTNEATLELAVGKALTELGVAKGTVAIDDAALATSIRRAGMEDLRVVPGDNLFLKIRLVKSAVEIDRMRLVSQLSGDAARTMMSQLTPGMTFEDVQAVFFSEVTRRGGKPDFIVAGMTSGLRNGRLVKHEPFLVDCVGHFDGYCGDFARTVVLGAPTQLLIDRSKQLAKVAEAITDLLTPGTRYSDIRKQGAELAKKIGVTFPIGFGPHSVGVTHSDDPYRDDLPFRANSDITLEPGMVITVDLPTLEPGWGSMHLESLILITDHGAEWLDRYDDPLYEVQV